MLELAPKLLLTISVPLHKANVSNRAIPNVCAILETAPTRPLLISNSTTTTTFLSLVPQTSKYTPKEGDPRVEETRERGVGGRGGCVAKTSAQARKVGGGRERAAPGGGRGHFATPDRLPQGLAFQSPEPEGRGWGKKKK